MLYEFSQEGLPFDNGFEYDLDLSRLSLSPDTTDDLRRGGIGGMDPIEEYGGGNICLL